MSSSHWLLISITVGPSLALVAIVWMFCRLILRLTKLHYRAVEILNDTVISSPVDLGEKEQP